MSKTPEYSIKELAELLGRSTKYVYSMRARGFIMRWDFKTRVFVATLPAARRWINQTGFTLHEGKPRFSGSKRF